MTEAEWLACADSVTMLEFLRSRATDRKLRLFGVVCCHRNWSLFVDERSRSAVTTAADFADGGTSADGLLSARRQAEEAWVTVRATPTGHHGLYYWGDAAAEAAVAVTAADAFPPAEDMVRQANYFVTAAGGVANAVAAHRLWQAADAWGAGENWMEDDEDAMAERWDGGRTDEWKWQASTLRDIFGNPFKPVKADPTWLTSTVVGLAQTIYDERAFDRMPILADALEEAGCDDDSILTHCRQPGEHVRGCWVVDLVLGKS